MDISVIIPAINEQESIGSCIASAWQADCDEVIVADGGSSDRTLEIVQQARGRLIEARPGRAVQQNAAAAVARGDVFLFVHADSRLGPETCAQIRAAFGSHRRVVGAFRQRIDSPRMAFRLVEWGNAMRVRFRGVAYGDQGIFVDRKTFQEIGGFPETPLLEDLLLMRRLKRVARPRLLEGPIHISPRRWQRHGLIRQTLRNRAILIAHACGVSPERLARQYRRHDEAT